MTDREQAESERLRSITAKASIDLLALAKQWADNKVHSYQFDTEARKIVTAAIRAAAAIGRAGFAALVAEECALAVENAQGKPFTTAGIVERAKAAQVIRAKFR